MVFSEFEDDLILEKLAVERVSVRVRGCLGKESKECNDSDIKFLKTPVGNGIFLKPSEKMWNISKSNIYHSSHCKTMINNMTIQIMV